MCVLINNISNNTSNWLNISVMAVQILLAVIFVFDMAKTKQKQNKFAVAKCLYMIVTVSMFAGVAIFGLNYFSKIVIEQTSLIMFILLILSELLAVVAFVIGLKMVKLSSNTTIIIDSSSQTPNFDDEISLKKRLDELNRKLEIKKIQEEILQKEKELDS